MIISQVSYRTNGPLVLVVFHKSEILKNAISEALRKLAHAIYRDYFSFKN